MPRKVFTAGEVLAAADVNSFLMDQTVMSFAGTAARGSAIGTAVEGMVAYLEDSNLLTSYNGSAWIPVANAGTNSYSYVDTVYFTSSGTFTKATYPWLRAIRVKVQGAGGGSGGCGATGAATAAVAGGGGGGFYSESFITNIAGLAASVTVTRGAGGSAGGAAASGGTGGTSSFGSLVSATGGNGGEGSGANSADVIPANGGAGSSAGVGDIGIPGGAGETPWIVSTTWHRGSEGGNSFLSNPFNGASRAAGGKVTATVGATYGGGSRGPSSGTSQTSNLGAAGGNGIVIVELYA